MKKLVLLFCFLTAACITANAQVEFFLGTFDDLKRKSATNDNHYFIVFEADWCEPCKRMKRDVFVDAELGTMVDRYFMAYQIDGESVFYKDIVKNMGVVSYPTILVFDSKNNEVARLIGYYDKESFKEELEQFLPDGNRTIYSEFR